MHTYKIYLPCNVLYEYTTYMYWIWVLYVCVCTRSPVFAKKAIEWSKFARKSSSNTETNRKRIEKRTITYEKGNKYQAIPSKRDTRSIQCIAYVWAFVHSKRMNFGGCYKQMRMLLLSIDFSLYNLNIFVDNCNTKNGTNIVSGDCVIQIKMHKLTRTSNV